MTSSDPLPLLSVERLHVRYGAVQALRDISGSVNHGALCRRCHPTKVILVRALVDNVLWQGNDSGSQISNLLGTLSFPLCIFGAICLNTAYEI